MSRRPVSNELSPRERQVYDLHCSGLDTAAITKALGGTTRSFVTQAKSTCRKKGYWIPHEPKHFKKQAEESEKNRRAVLDAVIDGHLTVTAIAKACDLCRATVCKYLSELKDAKLILWGYGAITLTMTAAGREQYKPDVYDEIYSDDALCSCGGPSLARFEWLFDQISAGRNG